MIKGIFGFGMGNGFKMESMSKEEMESKIDKELEELEGMVSSPAQVETLRRIKEIHAHLQENGKNIEKMREMEFEKMGNYAREAYVTLLVEQYHLMEELEEIENFCMEQIMMQIGDNFVHDLIMGITGFGKKERKEEVADEPKQEKKENVLNKSEQKEKESKENIFKVGI